MINSLLMMNKDEFRSGIQIGLESGPASLKELKAELKMLHSSRLLELCMQLAKYKKENKEYLTYLLFESEDEISYVKRIKEQIDNQFSDIKHLTPYKEKKAIQKILRFTNKFIKYSNSKQTEVELRLYFCQKIKARKTKLHINKVVGNLYQRQILKINKVLLSLHEDLQHDYNEELKSIL